MLASIGVLDIQGSVIEHLDMLDKIGGIDVIRVKKVSDVNKIDGLILPGGESTTIGMLLERSGLSKAIAERACNGMPLWGTCAGMILMAKKVTGQEDKAFLKLMDIHVVRNAYGTQLDSFKTLSIIEEVSLQNIPLVFIRAPYIRETGENVKVLCSIDNNIVAAEQENLLVTSFHPELTENTSFHEYFIHKVKQYLENECRA